MSSKKIVIITGANRGIGYETALAFAKRKFKVIMADKADQNKSRRKIFEATSNEDVITEFVDLGSFESVKKFSGKMLSTIDRLDVLVNNAGVFCMNKQKTEDNLDAVMQINHLGPFLLTNLLVDLLKESAGSRIIFVSSSGCFFHNLNIKNLEKPDYYCPHFISGAIHYYNTKLCNMISAKGFAHKLKEWKVISNCLHPGMTNTSFLLSGDDSRGWDIQFKKILLKCVTRDAQDAAGLVVFLSSSDAVKSISGKYFVNYQVHQEPRAMEDASFCRDIWNASEELIGLRKNSRDGCTK
nr:dehydrogenase/reductase SDR family member 13-like [Leptinotarsa decemlineata]